MTDLKPIETVYRGYRFRSRLEARWAVYFDTIGLSYEYEFEGFDLGSQGWYLPDFWLPGVQSWAEVKPTTPTTDQWAKAAALVHMTQKDLVFLVGSPEPKPYARLTFEDQVQRHSAEYGGTCHCNESLCADWPSSVSLCDAKIDNEYVDEHRWFVCCGGGEFEGEDLVRAVYAARSARFEHR